MEASGAPEGVAGPYAYDGSAWSFPRSSDLLLPWEGYAVKNSSTERLPLKIPANAAEISGRVTAKTVPSQTDDWTLQIKAEAVGGGESDIHNYLGFRSDADGKWDRYDLPEPPVTPGRKLQVYFSHLDWERYPGEYTSDFRPRAKLSIWDFVVDGNSVDTVVQLSILGLDELSGQKAKVVDVDGSLLLQMIGESQRIALSKSPRRFRVIVGEDELVDQETADFRNLPGSNEFTQNHPNPFNSTTEIKYFTKERGLIRLAVYDVIGRLVAVLDEGAKDPGYFTATWNGTDQNGHPTATGVYFYALEAHGHRLIGKMMLLR